MDQVSKVSPLPLRVMLAFSPAEYEKRFVDHYVAFYFRYAQASLALGLLLVFGDFLVDYLAGPGVRANFLRLELCLPIGWGAGLFLHSRCEEALAAGDGRLHRGHGLLFILDSAPH